MESNLERLKSIFEQMSNEGFNIARPQKWGFYFFDKDKKKLLDVFEELRDFGYHQEVLNRMDDGEWRLFVSKIDTMTPEKLHKRNIAFNQLAEACEVSLYDGWDVERIQESNKLRTVANFNKAPSIKNATK